MSGAFRDARFGAAFLALTLALGAPAFALDPASSAPSTVVTQIMRTAVTADGQPIVLPGADAQLVASIYDIAAGATLPVHRHPFPRYGYVLEGELVVTNVETGKSTTYGTGDFLVEMVGPWHQGSAVGAVPVKLLVIDQVEGDATNTILRQ